MTDQLTHDEVRLQALTCLTNGPDIETAFDLRDKVVNCLIIRDIVTTDELFEMTGQSDDPWMIISRATQEVWDEGIVARAAALMLKMAKAGINDSKRLMPAIVTFLVDNMAIDEAAAKDLDGVFGDVLTAYIDLTAAKKKGLE